MNVTRAQEDIEFVSSITDQIEGVFTSYRAGTLPRTEALISALEQARTQLSAVDLSQADDFVTLRRDVACGWIDTIVSGAVPPATAPMTRKPALAVPHMVATGSAAASVSRSVAAPVAPDAVAMPLGPVAAPAAEQPVGEAPVEPAPWSALESGETVAGHGSGRGRLYVLVAILVLVLVAAVAVAGGIVHVPGVHALHGQGRLSRSAFGLA